MPTVNSIQTGSLTIEAGDGTTVDVTITSVTQANSIVLHSERNNDNSSRLFRHGFQAALTSGTNLRFTRDDASFATDVIIEWSVIEFDAGEFQSIQTGTVNATADPTDTTITAVTVADTVPIVDGVIISANAHTSAKHNAVASITSTTNFRLDFTATPATDDYHATYQILEFNSDDVTIQTGEVALSSSEGSDTATITSVDTAKTMVLNGGLRGGNFGHISRTFARVKLTDATTVDVARSTAGSTLAMDVGYAVVEFDDHTEVEGGEATIPDGGSSVNPTFTELGADSVPFYCDWRINGYPSANIDVVDAYRSAFASIALSSPPDDIVLERVGTSRALEIGWFVADFTSGAPPAAPPPWYYHHISGMH